MDTKSRTAATMAAAENLARELEAAIIAALASRGISVRNPKELLGRLNCTCVNGSGCTYTLDGRNILWAGEPKIEKVGDTIIASRRIVHYGPEGKTR